MRRVESGGARGPRRAPLANASTVAPWAIRWREAKRVARLAEVHPLPVLLLVAIGLAGTGTSAVATYLSRYVFDALARRDLHALLLWTASAFGLFLIGAALDLWRAGLVERLGKRWVGNLRRAVMVHILNQDVAFVQRHHSGELTSLITQDVQQIQDMTEKLVLWTIFDSVRIVLGMVLIAKLSLPLLWFTLLTAPLYAVTTRRVQGRFWSIRQRLADIRSTIATNLTERVGGFATALAFNQQQRFARELEDENRTYVVEEMRSDALRRRLDFQNDVLQGTLRQVAPLLGLAFLPHFNVGIAVAYLGLFAQVSNPVRSLLGLPVQAASCFVSLGRVLRILDERPGVADRPGAYPVRLTGDVAFEAVRFAYDPGVPVLRSVSFRIGAGQTVALVGNTGAGKSTIAALLARYHDRDGGRILLDGHDIERISLPSLRAQVATVEQSPTMFRDTIRNNIRFARPDATLEDVRRAAAEACIAEEVEALPDGYDTRLGERGVNLSGGQRQRIAIARLILANPTIVVLDEATAALDVVTEAEVQRALDRLCRQRTTLVIAHRLSTVWKADRILLLHEGVVAEQGSHEELLKLGGRYAAMVKGSAVGADLLGA